MRHQKNSRSSSRGIPTIRDLAAHLNLSPASVAQALGGKSATIRVSEETTKKVRDLAQKLGYRPNRAAQIMRTGRTGLLGVITQASSYNVHAEYLYYTRQFARELGLMPFIHEIHETTGAKEEETSLAVDSMLDMRVDAVLLQRFMSPEISRLTKAGLPIVCTGLPMVHDLPGYSADKRGGFVLLARHLIQQGNTRIALLTVKSDGADTHSASVLQGIRGEISKARRSNGKIAFRVHYATPQNAIPHLRGQCGMGYSGMKEILASGEIPDALICCNDLWAQGAILACTEHGLEIPGDIAVCGFDDSPSSAFGTLPLTSVAQPVEEMHRLALADLNTMLSTGKHMPARRTLLPCKLSIRQSTLCVRK